HTASGRDGFLPWLLVAAAAPRHQVYAHEFGWFKEGDPTWHRLQAVYGFRDAGDRLSFTHGKGDVSKRPPEGTHCTHIGALHRVMMHDAFRNWFQIDMSADKEYSQRLESDKLRCWIDQAKSELKPRTLMSLMNEVAAERLAAARKERAGKPPAEQRRLLQAQWAKVLGNVEPAAKRQVKEVSSEKLPGAHVKRFLLTLEPGVQVPVVLLLPAKKSANPPVVVMVGQEGKSALLKARAAEIVELLDNSVAVCLPDVRGTGETGLGKSRDYRSLATALSSSQLMLDEPLVAGQLRDLRGVLAWLRSRPDVDGKNISLWGDSLARVNAADTNFKIPHDGDAVMPPASEPLGGLLALLGSLYDVQVRAVYIRGGLAEFRSVLDSHLVLIPHDVVVPGLLKTGDLSDVAAALAPRPVRLDGLVDGLNRRLSADTVKKIYGERAGLTVQADPESPVKWLIATTGAGR
ncbi:MAG: alpha/beta hydrolase family protein, partial [Gemmataceae bacterium]